jgi:hypothetical protein
VGFFRRKAMGDSQLTEWAVSMHTWVVFLFSVVPLSSLGLLDSSSFQQSKIGAF